MALTAMTGADWEGALDFSNKEGGGPQGMVDVVNHLIKYGWGTDQVSHLQDLQEY